MNKNVTLKDGTEVDIRTMMPSDLDASFAFFKALPEEDRLFLRTDVTKVKNIRRRIKFVDTGRVRRIVAVSGDEIVADGVLELEGHSWKEHVGELRLIVARSFQRKGLGMLMARELFLLAVAEKVEVVVVKLMRPQKVARGIFDKLGFHEEIVIPDYVKDITGKRRDLILKRCDLEALWKKLDHHLMESDWQRTR